MGYPHADSLTETRVRNTSQKTGFVSVGSTSMPLTKDFAIVDGFAGAERPQIIVAVCMHHRPGHSSDLVGQGDDHDVGMLTRTEFSDPNAQRILFLSDGAYRGTSAVAMIGPTPRSCCSRLATGMSSARTRISESSSVTRSSR